MIRHVLIKNFRGIRNAAIDLAPLTVLVGPNGSGKTTVLFALAPARGLAQSDFYRHDTSIPVDISYTYGDGSAGALGTNAGHRGLRHAYQRLRLDIDKLRVPNAVQQAPRLSEDGSNLANVFGSLTRRQQEHIATQLSALVPLFQDVDVQTPQGQSGVRELRFQDRWNSNVWYAPAEVSDGTMLLVAFLTLQYQMPPVDLVVIEEPDRGLHPYLMSQLIGMLRRLTTGEIGGKPTQVVLATHSAELLEFVRPEEVRFLDRNKDDGTVHVTMVDPNSEDWRDAYREYNESLGGAWLSGNLGGVPGQ